MSGYSQANVKSTIPIRTVCWEVRKCVHSHLYAECCQIHPVVNLNHIDAKLRSTYSSLPQSHHGGVHVNLSFSFQNKHDFSLKKQLTTTILKVR